MEFAKKGSEQGGAPGSPGTQPGRREPVATTLGEDTEFSGTMKFGNSLTIEGKFQGDLTSPGHLIIGRTGQVRAEVKVGNLTIEGKLTGNIQTQDVVDLRSTAEVFGDITAARIKIEEGVVFVGKAEIKPRDSKSNPLQKDMITSDKAPEKPPLERKAPPEKPPTS